MNDGASLVPEELAAVARFLLRSAGTGLAQPRSMLAVLSSIAALPWLSGFEPVAVADEPARDVQVELAEWQGAADEHCVASAYGGLRVAAGDDTVLASYTQGLLVLRGGQAIARAPGFDCFGSADELVALATGDAELAMPVIAVAATSGGHAENATWLAMYRIGDRGELAPIFTAIVERHAGHQTRTGVVVLFPGGLVYRSPDGGSSLWLYDRDLGRYVEQLALGFLT